MSGEKKVSVAVEALNKTKEGLAEAKHSVKEFSHEVKELVAEAFVGFTIFEFFKTAIEKATEAEQSYVQLSNTLANVGVSYEHNREKIEETIKSLQKVANVRTDEAIKGFNTLVQRSGDYNGSMKNLVLVADLAKAKHLEFNDAAELVGRVMGGNTRVLKQFGIVTKDATDGINQLRERIHGAAEADMATFGGRVEWTKNRLFDLLEGVGDVITGNSSLAESFKGIGEWLIKATKYLEENRAEFGAYFSAVVTGVKEVGRDIVDLVKIAFHGGESIGHFLELLANIANPAKRKEAFDAMMKSGDDAKAAAVDLGETFDRMSVAAERASQSETEGVKRTEGELEAAAAANKRRLAERAAAEQAARDKAAKALEDARNKAIDTQLAQFGKAAQLREFKDRAIREQALAGLNLMESLARRELAGMENTNATLGKRLVLEDRLAKIAEEKKKAGVVAHPESALDTKSLSGADMNARDLNAEIGATDATVSLTKLREQFHLFRVDFGAIPRLGFTDEIGHALDNIATKLAAGKDAVQQLGDMLVDVSNGPIGAFSTGISAAMSDMVTGSHTAGAAFRQSMAKALASIAKIEGDYFAARALGGTAKGLGGNPLGFAEQVQYALAAAAMYAVAGIAGGLGGGGGGGGVGGGSAASNASFQSGLATAAQGTVTVVLNGSRLLIDANDPSSQDEFKAMIQKLAGNRQLEFIVQ